MRSRLELAHEVVLLREQGLSQRAIARSLRVARKTVSKFLGERAAARERPHSALPTPRARTPRASKLDTHRAQIDSLLARYDDITAQRIFEEIRLQGYDGRYTVVKDLVRRLRPPRRKQPSLPAPQYGPGKMAECDWSPYTIRFTTGLIGELQAFSYALVYSHRKAFGMYPSNDIHALMDGHVEAFQRFEGVAATTKYDSQKPVVLRWEGNQPIYNLRFVDFATHYRFRLAACRRGHPNDKPRVERSFLELKMSFFKGREFRDVEDLRAQLRWWNSEVSDRRSHRRLKRTPLELFAEEQPHLRERPAHDYDTARVLYRLCDIEGFVSWEGNRYSLPYDYVTDILPVRITQREIFVYAADLSLISHHELRPKGRGDDAELPGHHPRATRGTDLGQLRRAFEDMGPPAQAFLAGLERARARSAGYHARHVLTLRQRYHTADLVKALDHAQRFGAFEHTAVERILLSRATPRRLDEYVTERHLNSLLDESGPEIRDLSEYDALPCWNGSSPREGDRPCPPAAEARPPSNAPPVAKQMERIEDDP